MAKLYSYNKIEKLKSRKQLDQLFENGKSFTIFPLKILYTIPEKQEALIKTGVGTSSKNFKKATDRNRIKRLLREVYRLEKTPLHIYLNSNNKQLALFLLYVDKTIPQFNLLKEKMKLGIQHLISELNEMVTENN